MKVIPYTFFQEMKDKGIIGSPLDARTLATTGMALLSGFNLQHFVNNHIQIQGMVNVYLNCFRFKKLVRKMNNDNY